MIAALISIWLVHTAALAIPGANTMIVTQLAMSGPAKNAYRAAFGIATGALLWTSAAALGVRVLFDTFPTLRATMQIGGALYLFYIAIKLWKPAAITRKSTATVTGTRAYRMGLLTNLLNPKAALFFGSIFSASLATSTESVWILSAVVLVVANSLLWHLSLAYLFSRRRIQAVYSKQQSRLQRIAASIVGAFGLRMLVSSIVEAHNQVS